MKKHYQSPRLLNVAVITESIIATSVDIEGSNQMGPEWSDELTYEDALNKFRDDWNYDW